MAFTRFVEIEGPNGRCLFIVCLQTLKRRVAVVLKEVGTDATWQMLAVMVNVIVNIKLLSMI